MNINPTGNNNLLVNKSSTKDGPAIAWLNTAAVPGIRLVNKLSAGQTTGLCNIDGFEYVIMPIAFRGKSQDTHLIPTKTPVFLLSTNRSSVYLVKPGEVLNVSRNSHNQTVVTTDNSTKRDDELAFFNNLTSVDPEPSLMHLKNNSNANFELAENSYNDWYARSTAYLANYTKSKLLDESFSVPMGKYLYYMRLSGLLGWLANSSIGTEILEHSPYKDFPACDYCLAMPHYKFAAYYYNKILSKEAKNTTSFQAEFDGAKIHLTGDTRKSILFGLLNSSMNTSMENNQFTQRMQYFLSAYPKDTLAKVLDQSYQTKQVVLRSLVGHSVSDEQVLTADGKLIKWKDVLAANKGKIIFIDFWARYCGPCIHEIPFSHTLESKFKSKAVSFIYVSFDVSRATWLAGMDELNFTNRKNCYLIAMAAKSSIQKFYNVSHIPKYVVYNKSGVLINRDAPRPSSLAFNQVLNTLIQ